MAEGSWQTIAAPWYETRIIHCQLCGRMIARRMWVPEGGSDGQRPVFCKPACASLYREYWLPRYGRGATPAGARTGAGDDPAPP